jgi:hypothetical protein
MGYCPEGRNMGSLFDLSLFSVSPYPEFELRGDDHVLSSCLDFFCPLRNEGKIYAALLRLATLIGKDNGDGTWTVRVGYTDLRRESGCSTRALGRAWPRLEHLGFLVEREAHKDRRPARYIIRSIELLNSRYKVDGCTHFRVMPNLSLQPFRAKAMGYQVAQ